MKLIDTHTHLFVESFDEDRNEVMGRARLAGVSQFLLPNIDVETIARVEEMCAVEQDCFPMMGLHPSSVGMGFHDDLVIVRDALVRNDCVAVGEIGIDLYWAKTYLKQQKEALKIQCEWAKDLSLPVVIHARESFDEIFEVIDEVNDETLTGVFHCFTGTVEQGKRILDYGGFKMGLGGVLTFKKSGLDAVVKELPMDAFVLETDSPYLAPTPFRGKRNESSYVINVAQKLADVYEVKLEYIAEVTTRNAKSLFTKLP